MAESRVREDMLDYPTAWRIQREGLEHISRKCSAAQTNGAILCDCTAVEKEWEYRVARQQREERRA